MTALAADKKVTWKDGEYISAYVKAAQQIYLGAMVTIYPSTGYAYAGVDTSTHRFIGVAEENVLGVTDGVEMVKCRCRGVVKLVGAGLAITDVGKDAWLSDDNTITTTPTNVLVGKIVGVPSAATAWVDLFGGPLPTTALGATTITGNCTVTGIATFTGRPIIPTVLFASLGAATAVGQICYCATGHGGLPGILVANGTNWIAPDGATAAET